MSRAEDIQQRVAREAGSDSTSYRLIEHIFGERYDPQILHSVTPKFIEEATGCSLEGDEFQLVAGYLSNEALNLFELRFEYFVDDDTLEPLSRSELYAAELSGELLNPETGEEIPEWRSRVVVYLKCASGLADALYELRVDE